MRSVFLGFTLALGALTAACTIDPPAGTPTPPMAGALEPGPREATFGRTGDEVVNNPQLRDKIRNLFGADWTPAAEGRGKIAKGAAAYFASHRAAARGAGRRRELRGGDRLRAREPAAASACCC